LSHRHIKDWKRPTKNKTDLNEEDAPCVESQQV
jgi:hypothetical protein